MFGEENKVSVIVSTFADDCIDLLDIAPPAESGLITSVNSYDWPTEEATIFQNEFNAISDWLSTVTSS